MSQTSRALWGSAVALAFAVGSVAPSSAAAASMTSASAGEVAGGVPLLFKKRRRKKKRGGIQPDTAEPKRDAIRAAAQEDMDAGNLDAAARTLEENAALLGDPLTMMEAGEARLRLADKDRDIAQANAAIETTRVALDILHFFDSVSRGEAKTPWVVIRPSQASTFISDADAQIAAAERLIAEIEAEEAAKAAALAKNGKRRRKKNSDGAKRERLPGTGMIAAGSVLTVAGVTGASLGIAGLAISSSRQNEVEDLPEPVDPAEVERLDDEGRRANSLGYVGLGVGIVGLAIGIPLLAVGVKRRKASKEPPASARVQVGPHLGRTMTGLSVSGRF